MVIREYTHNDELAWLRCRVLSFLDCSYYNDVLTQKESYKNDAVCLVAEEDGKIIGFMDVEIESKAGDICVAGSQPGAVIWNLGVLPEFRRKHVAASLWEEASRRLLAKGIHYCEVWTQEDEAANRWYQSLGFHNVKEKNWLRCYARPSRADWFLNRANVGEIFGVEEMIFEAAPARREEVSEYCYRIDQVRLYAKEL